MCFKAKGSSFRCATTSRGSLQAISRNLAVADQNSLAAMEFGLKLQRKVIFPLLAGAGVTLLIGAISVAFMKLKQQKENKALKKGEEEEKEPSRFGATRRFTNSSLFSSVVLGVAAAVSTMMAIGASKFASKIANGPALQQGTMLQGMEFAGVLLNLIFVTLASDLALESSTVMSMPEAEFMAYTQPRRRRR